MNSHIKNLILIITVLFIASSFVRVYRVSEISMYYNLMEDDLVIVENISAGIHIPSWFFYSKGHIFSHEEGIHRGDIMAFKHSLDDRLYLKRVTALAGDSVFQKDKDFYLQIDTNETKTLKYAYKNNLEVDNINNEIWLKNPYHRVYHISHDDFVIGPQELIIYPKTRIPEHHYFFMGDYRDNSADSRFFGPVPYDQIYYKVHTMISSSRNLEERGQMKLF